MALMMLVFVRSRPARNTCPDRTPPRLQLLALVRPGRGEQLVHEPLALGRQLAAVRLG